MNGTTRVDGSHEKLSQADLQLVLQAKTRLIESGANFVTQMRRIAPSFECACPEPNGHARCMSTLRRLLRPEEDPEKLQPLLTGLPLDKQLQSIVDDLHERGDRDVEYRESVSACKACAQEAQEMYAELRTEVWNALPKIAGVENEVYLVWRRPRARMTKPMPVRM